MENREQRNPETDISKSQSAQNAPEQVKDQNDEVDTSESKSFETGQADYGSASGKQADQRKGETEGRDKQAGFVAKKSDDGSNDQLIERDSE